LCRICFLSDHMLYDVGEDAAQCWRLEGDEWDEDEDGEEEGEEEGAAAAEEEGGAEVHTAHTHTWHFVRFHVFIL
jgi:hypothetical protein